MTVRKIELMYRHFGEAAAGNCKDCQHYTQYRYRDKPYRKCEVYGVTCSEATDWAGKYKACGLYPDKPYGGKEIVKTVRWTSEKEPEQQIDGQISLFDV